MGASDPPATHASTWDLGRGRWRIAGASVHEVGAAALRTATPFHVPLHAYRHQPSANIFQRPVHDLGCLVDHLALIRSVPSVPFVFHIHIPRRSTPHPSQRGGGHNRTSSAYCRTCDSLSSRFRHRARPHRFRRLPIDVSASSIHDDRGRRRPGRKHLANKPRRWSVENDPESVWQGGRLRRSPVRG